MKAAESQVLSVYVERPLALVTAFLANPLNMNHWARGLGHSLHQEGGEWRAAGPGGPVRVRFSPRNDFAIADHWVEVAPGVEVYVPLRAIAHGDGCDVQLVLLRLPDMSDDEYARDADLMRLDLTMLKSVLEKQ